MFIDIIPLQKNTARLTRGQILQLKNEKKQLIDKADALIAENKFGDELTQVQNDIKAKAAAIDQLTEQAAVSAAGASGVAGGSLLLIPMACGLFGVPGDIAMQVVGVGFIVGVIQDSMETGINSSTDVLFTAAADIRAKRLAKK